MKGKLFSIAGILGIIATFIVAVTTFSSKDLLCAPFITIGVLLSIVIIALGEFLDSYQKNQNNGGTKKRKTGK